MRRYTREKRRVGTGGSTGPVARVIDICCPVDVSQAVSGKRNPEVLQGRNFDLRLAMARGPQHTRTGEQTAGRRGLEIGTTATVATFASLRAERTRRLMEKLVAGEHDDADQPRVGCLLHLLLDLQK